MKCFAARSFLALLMICSAGLADAGGPEHAVERQDVSVTLMPDSHALTGASTITFAPGARQVSLRLAASASVSSVTVSGKRVAFSFVDGIISLELPAGSTATSSPVQISYRAHFNDPISHHPAAAEEPSYGVTGTITREGTFLGDSAFWYPVPRQTPSHRFLQIAAPAGIEGISYGRRVSRGTVGAVTSSLWEEARPVGVLTLCAGPYLVESRSVAGIELYSYLYADNAALSGRYLDAAAVYLKFYSDLFGPYPFEKFALVENFFQTGYGFPSFTLLGGMVIRLPFIIDTSFPHEIAHCWWGNAVQVDLREGNWSEGLVSYLADYLLKERRSASEGLQYRKQLLVDYASLVTPAKDFPLKEFESRSDPASRAIGYGKGAMVFHMVRSLIGDPAFFGALREVYRDHRYRSASWGDFARAFSRSSGRDLWPFLDQWLSRSGGPRLDLKEVTSRRSAGGWTVSGLISQAPPLFQLGVPLRLQSAGGPIESTVFLTGERTRFSIASASQPKRLLLDPDAEVFRILTAEEIPATVNSIKGSTRLVGVITENCRAGGETFRDLLASLSQGGAKLMKESDLERQGAAGSDLLFCGIPRNRSLLPRLPEGTHFDDSRFSVDGQSYAAADSVLFVVLPIAGSPGWVAAVFQPLSEAAALKYAPKITHYGKYSYLVFAGGANRSKGTFPAFAGGTVVDLSATQVKEAP